MTIRQIRIGARCRFVPSHRQASEPVKLQPGSPKAVDARIVYVNHPHRWFRVVYPAGNGYTLSECLKF